MPEGQTEENQSNSSEASLKLPVVSDFLSSVWNLYKNRFAALSLTSIVSYILSGFAAFVVLFVLVIGIIIAVGTGAAAGGDVMEYVKIIGPTMSVLIGGSVIAILIYAVQAFSSGALTYISLREESTLGDAVGYAFKQLPGLFLVTLLVSVLVGLSSLLIIPGIYFAVAFSLSIAVFIDEDHTGFDCLKRSMELVKGYWWALFGRYFLVGLLLMIAFGFIGLIASGINNEAAQASIMQIFQILFAIPAYAVTTVVAYRQLIARK
jgi:hypothetical protein